jgi:hypothetical protein
MEKPTQNLSAPGARGPERGAALITVLLMATLLLMAGAALVAVTSTSATNAADATAESQAYYAAEAGMQGVLGALRGVNAPDPLLNGTLTSDENKISFRRAVDPAKSNASGTGTPRLTRWLDYDATYTDRVVLNSAYAPLTGMAYSVDEISDPDNSDVVVFSTSGAVGSPTPTTGLTINYSGRTSATVSTSTSTSTNIGSFTYSISSGSGNGTYTAGNVPYALTITQTAPWPATKVINCTINGAVTKTGSNVTGTLTITFPTSVYAIAPKTSFSLDGVTYTLATTAFTFDGASATSIPATIAPPEPQRLRVRVKGYGPRNAVKMMQMLVARSNFDYNATGAITLRSADDNTITATQMHLDIGSSAVFSYSGNDHANGPDLPAFTVTGDQDVALINALPGGQVTGSPNNVRKVAVSELDKFLQTTDGPNGARAALDKMRLAAKNLKTPGCTDPNPDVCDRYYGPGETAPSNIGLGMTDGITTFVDGNYTMPAAGGAGLLVVTGTLTMLGNADFKGLILVLGDGHVERNGGGGDTSLGAMAIARFGSSGNFLEPTYNVQGAGSSHMLFDSEWVRKALKSAGPGVLGVSEY